MKYSMDDFLTVAGNLIYATQALLAIFGVFLVILIFRRIAQKRFRSAGQYHAFMEQVREAFSRRDLQGVQELCDTPQYWSKAVPQLMMLGLGNIKLGIPRLRKLLAEHFERDVIAEMDYQMAWINTIIKTAPMLGLLGTVQGMIQAFGKIAAVSKETGTDPQMLANDISFALLTTAYGLMIAIPLVMFMSAIQVRIAKLQDNVQQGVGEFLELLEASGKA